MINTYLGRKNPSGKYVFVSYSHADGEAVSKLLSALNDYGADFWYDAELKTGQNWLKKVEEVTANKNCCGILYLVSPDFIFSEACLKEFDMAESLEKSHKKFGTAYVLMGDGDPMNLQNFLSVSTQKLLGTHPADFDKILERTGHFSKKFDKDRIYKTGAFGRTDDDGLVNSLIKDVFATWGCLSQESGKIDALAEDGLTDANYRIKTSCRIVENVVNGQDAEWKVFAYNGDTISAIFVSDELYGAACRSLAVSVMDYINDGLFLDKGDARLKEKHIELEPSCAECLKKDGNGKAIRFLRAAEHENNYPQLKEVLEKAPLTDSIDDGYFFVGDSQGNILFADRGSDDVYRQINVDACASIIPVIDIDYNKYKKYLLGKNL